MAFKKIDYSYKYYGVYQTTNLINGKIYVGTHRTDNLNDKYLGSNKHLRSSIKKYGRDQFKREWLHIFDNNEDMCNKEIELVNEDFVSRDDTYNETIGGLGGPHFKSRKHSEETKQRIKMSMAGKKLTAEHIENVAKTKRGKPLSAETRKRISEAKKNNDKKQSMSEETRKKISDSLKKRYSLRGQALATG